MPKTKEQIKKYNKEYFARPGVIARAKVRNAKPEHKARRKRYKKTERGKAAEKRYRDNNPRGLKQRLSRLWSRYGLKPEDYVNMFEEQNGLCAICDRPPKTVLTPLDVDHCHTTGKVRGLLCGSCNRAIGLLGDDVGRMKKAIKYLNNAIHSDNSNKEDSKTG